MIWNAHWMRHHYFPDVPEEHIWFVDRPHGNGWRRDWFVRLRFGPRFVPILVLSQSYLVSPTGSNQTTNGGVDATWNNSNNTIDVIAAGGSGGASQITAGCETAGGGGGEHGQTPNFNISNPGTDTFTWQIGAGGTAVFGAAAGSTGQTQGNKGGDTWFNGTTQAGSTLGAIGGSGGGVGLTGASGGAGGTGGVGTTHHAGGRGGNGTDNTGTSGGGGAGGPNGAGNQGVDGTGATNGGQGDGSSGGTGGLGTGTGTTGNPGNPGTELGDGIHGCGGGGGGLFRSLNGTLGGGNTGGLYGGGGGSTFDTSAFGNSRAQSGAGAQGLIVLTWTPAAGGAAPCFLPLLGVGTC